MRTRNVCPAPTNTPGTCITCGRKLRIWYSGYHLVNIQAASPEQLKDWPVHHVYSADTGHYLYTEYLNFGRLVEGETQGLWMGPHAGGDDLFCKTTCAVAFARIAANMGLRLPSVTKKEQRARRQYHRFLKALTPAELEPTPRRPNPEGQIRRSKDEVGFIAAGGKNYRCVCLDQARHPVDLVLTPKK